MKKIVTAGIAALTLALVGCSSEADQTTGPAGGETSAAPTESSADAPAAAETTTPGEVAPETTPARADAPAPGRYPAQEDMTQFGANADRVNGFQDKRGKFWICDKATPNGNPEVDFYNTPNGCAGPYDTEEEASVGLYRAVHDGLADEFDLESNFDDYLTEAPASPAPRNSQDIADGIAESMGCESAVFNESTESYDYVGCP